MRSSLAQASILFLLICTKRSCCTKGLQSVHLNHSNNRVHAKALIATMEPPNVVLLDIALPDTNGLDLLAYLRTQTHWQKTAVAPAHDRRR